MSTITGTNFAEYNFDEIIKESYFEGLTITFKISGAAQDITDYTFDLWWRRNNVKGEWVKKSDETSGITITDAANGIFQIDAFQVDFEAGIYYYDLMITDDSAIKNIYMFGTMTVKENSTE